MSSLDHSSMDPSNPPVSEEHNESTPENDVELSEEENRDVSADNKQKSEDEMEIESNGYIKFKGSPDARAPRTVKRCDLVMACPVRGCSPQKMPWKCDQCETLIEYGFGDRKFYCECGQFTSNGCEYACGAHEMKNADYARLKNLLSTLEPPRDLNLLILGETGVGKSTFINAFINYLTYSTLDDAVNGELITLVPNKFTITDEEMNTVSVENGKKTEDEDLTAGQSATQLTKVHRFSHKDAVVRIIDTPGIGDVRGTLQDNKNFEDILKTIASLDELHGIIVLLKPNAARLTITFRYCIEELLVHLHKSAKDNIIFGFTNTRGTNFRPGDTMPALLEHLKKTNTDIKCTKDNVYCFDSEGYRLLAAHFYGIRFDEGIFDSYRKSWDYSVKETQRLLSYIANLRPHATKETLSLNTVRLLILQLTKPMAEITKNIMINVENLKREEARIQGLAEDTENLSNDLMFDKIKLDAKELGHPRTVCTNPACVQITSQEGHSTINYVTWCHDRCHLDGVQVETTKNTALMKCKAMRGTDTCFRCKHNYAEHMHITYELIETTVKVENQFIKQLIEENASLKDLKEAAIDGLREMIDELKQEHIMIEKTAAQFGAFLEHNAITTYSDARLEYLQFLIDEEKKKKAEHRDENLLAALQDSLRIYTEEVAFINKSIGEGKGSELLQIPQIERSITHLNDLKHSGEMLQQIKDVALKTCDKCFREENHKLNHLSVYTSGISRLVSPLYDGIKGALSRIGCGRSSHQKEPQPGPSTTNAKTPQRTYATRASTIGNQNYQSGNVIQRTNEKIDSYFSRCLQSLSPGLSEEQRVQILIDGLQGEFLVPASDQEFTKVCHLRQHLENFEPKRFKK